MRTPIKINSELPFVKHFSFLPQVCSPKYITKPLAMDEQRFTQGISALKFGNTFKTTKTRRHLETDSVLVDRINPNDSILDVGASTGITSLELMHKINFSFQKYFVTDYNLEIEYNIDDKNNYFFFDVNNQCILICNSFFIIYILESRFVQALFKKNINNQARKRKEKLLLVDSKLKALISDNKNIEIRQYNVLEEWRGPKVKLVKAANIFNRTYFEDFQIVKGINNLKNSLLENGLIAIIDNRNKEKSSIFRLESGNLLLDTSLNGGSDVEGLVRDNFDY